MEMAARAMSAAHGSSVHQMYDLLTLTLAAKVPVYGGRTVTTVMSLIKVIVSPLKYL